MKSYLSSDQDYEKIRERYPLNIPSRYTTKIRVEITERISETIQNSRSYWNIDILSLQKSLLENTNNEELFKTYKEYSQVY